MPKLTPERLAELRRIAEAATSGPWTADAGYIVVLGPDGWAEKSVACLDIDGSPMDDEHIAAFDPTTVLALLDRIEALEKHPVGTIVEKLSAGLAAALQAHRDSNGDFCPECEWDLPNHWQGCTIGAALALVRGESYE